MLNFYDFEVFKKDWLVVIINPQEQNKTVIVSDNKQLENYYYTHKNQIWVGYNSRNYDQYILKAILLGFNPKTVNDFIINDGRKGWEYSNAFNKIQLYNYDCANKFYGLKQLEAFMLNDIKETSVPFNIDRKLTPAEIAETIKYCTHDVEQTMQVFLKTKPTFDTHMNVINTFNLPFSSVSKTGAQLTALALGANKKTYRDEWEYSSVDTLQIRKYAHVARWFAEQREIKDYDEYLEIDVMGVPHVFGWGGLHGAPDQPLHRKGIIIHLDVTSFYPSIMIKYDMLSRNVSNKRIYEDMYRERVEAKKSGDKARANALKLILNSTYGASKDKYNALYDPRRANEVCVNGQLLLLDLLEHLEGYCHLIQSNTDGLIVQLDDVGQALDNLIGIIDEWQYRTGMTLGVDIISEIWQKDVNNYLFVDDAGNIERKGAYVKELNALDNDLPIINRALVDYMVKGVSVKDTVYGCDELWAFQKIVKVSSKYECAWHNGHELSEKTLRVFASKNTDDTHVGKVKVKKTGRVIEKFANTPTHAFINNDTLHDVECPPFLDKDYYVTLAVKRLEGFGIVI